MNRILLYIASGVFLIFAFLFADEIVLQYTEQPPVSISRQEGSAPIADSVLKNISPPPITPARTASADTKVVTQLPPKVSGTLRSTARAPDAVLTRAGVLAWTNSARAKEGLFALTEHPTLDIVAEQKVADMFNRQYFEHNAPTGEGVADLVRGVGYAYIVVGENLALGDYENDERLVAAWMASPGHRANILHPRFSEIGIAVGKGIFEGRTTWLAVQTFALSASACPMPDSGLKTRITEQTLLLDALSRDLENRKRELDAYEPKHGAAWREQIRLYNALIEEYNRLADETKAIIDLYNAQVLTVNACIAGES